MILRFLLEMFLQFLYPDVSEKNKKHVVSEVLKHTWRIGKTPPPIVEVFGVFRPVNNPIIFDRTYAKTYWSSMKIFRLNATFMDTRLVKNDIYIFDLSGF